MPMPALSGCCNLFFHWSLLYCLPGNFGLNKNQLTSKAIEFKIFKCHGQMGGTSHDQLWFFCLTTETASAFPLHDKANRRGQIIIHFMVVIFLWLFLIVTYSSCRLSFQPCKLKFNPNLKKVLSNGLRWMELGARIGKIEFKYIVLNARSYGKELSLLL